MATKQYINVPTIGLVPANIVRAGTLSDRPTADGTQGFWLDSATATLYVDENGTWVPVSGGGGGGGSGGALIIPRAPQSGSMTITSAVAVNVTGCSATITPLVDTDVIIIGVFDVTANSAIADTFVGELTISGVTQSAQAIFKGVNISNDRATVAQEWTLSMTAGVTYVFQLTARLNLGTGSYVLQDHTGLSGVEAFGSGNGTGAGTTDYTLDWLGW